MSGDETTPETARIERDLAQTRSRLDATIDALQDKLSPGQMVDQAVNYLKDTAGGGEFSRNLQRSVTEHPLPVALIGVGVAWLMAAGARRTVGAGDVAAFPTGSTPPAGSGGTAVRGGRFRVGPAYPAPAVGGGATRIDARGVYARGGGGDAGRLTRDPRERDDLAAHGSYASAALEDLATKANSAGSGVGRDAGEDDDAYEGRVHAARGAVLGLKRSLDENLAAFRERVDAAVRAAGDAYARARAGLSSAMGGGDDGDTTAMMTATTKGGQSVMSSLYERGRDAAGDVYDYGRAAVGGVAGSVSGGAGAATRGARGTISYIQDQPLLLGAIGVSLGAVLAMLVPATRYERELVGEALGPLGDNVRERARGVAGEAFEGATRVARAVMDTARDAAGREGLTDYSASGLVSAAREQVAEAAGRVRSVVEEAASAGREALERELDAAKDEVASPPVGGGAGAGTGTAGHGGGPLGGQQQQKRDPAGGGNLA